MTPEEIRELAERIADLLAEREWIPGPVRPEPPAGPTPGKLPPWSGAAQQLGDVAPARGRASQPGRHRPSYEALTVAARAAAAGTGPAPTTGLAGANLPRHKGSSIPIAISNRHIHVSRDVLDALFGAGHQLTSERKIRQPGQFAAAERVTVIGPRGAIQGVRIVGPTRDRTQVELAGSDCRVLGLDAPIRNSGSIEGSAGVRLEGPAGSADLNEGAIVAARHLHVAMGDEERLGVTDGDRVTIEVGAGDRRAMLHDVLVRSGPSHATELHVDADEAQAFHVASGDTAQIVGRPRRGASVRTSKPSRSLITERDVAAIAASGRTLTDAGPHIVTPAARDRAIALGIWRGGR